MRDNILPSGSVVNNGSHTKLQTPTVERGAFIISYFNKCYQVWHNEQPEQKRQWFIKAYSDDANYILDKFNNNEIGRFYLNLDNQNQKIFLYNICGDFIELDFPNIDNWKDIGEKYGRNDWDKLDMEDIRTIAVWFKELSEWECYPQDLIWIRKFFLYANNNSINNQNYKGEKFGNVTNWIPYFESMTEVEKLSFVKILQDYR